MGWAGLMELREEGESLGVGRPGPGAGPLSWPWGNGAGSRDHLSEYGMPLQPLSHTGQGWISFVTSF